MFRKNFDTLLIALIFVGASKFLAKVNFWKAIGLSEPTSFIFTGLLFLALVMILQHTLFNPFEAITVERNEQTTEKRKRADERKLHAESILKSYEQSILNARMDALKQRERIAIEAENQERTILEAAKQKSQKSLEAAMEEISVKIENTRKELVTSSTPLVVQLVEEILSPSVHNSKNASSTKTAESRM